MLLIIILSILLLAIGIYEKHAHQKNLDSIPIRINVNGIRGKSTVTRLMTGILSEAGYRVIGKTTGTEARILYWNTKDESKIIRRPEGPNIGEQRKIVATAAKLDANVLVSECMAVNPDYQLIYQNQMVQANIGVIVNVLEDHMDVMGPTLNNIADAFTSTIPYDGKLIIAPGTYENFFKDIAKKRNTEVFVAETSKIGQEQLRRFSSIYFPENVALALALAKALDIDEKTAWKGMLEAKPDPGVVKVHKLNIFEKTTYFVNGFAANDVTSTFAIWKMVIEIGYPTNNIAVLINCRPDRMDRTYQFAEDFLPYFPSDLLVCMGLETKNVVDAYNAGKIVTDEFYDAKGANGAKIYKAIEEKLAGKIIFGVCNIHGTAEEFITALLNIEPPTCNLNDENIGEDEGDDRCTETNYTLH